MINNRTDAWKTDVNLLIVRRTRQIQRYGNQAYAKNLLKRNGKKLADRFRDHQALSYSPAWSSFGATLTGVSFPSWPVAIAFVRLGRCVPLSLNSRQKTTMVLPSGAWLFQGKINRTVGFLVWVSHFLIFDSSNDEQAKAFSLFVMVGSECSKVRGLHNAYCKYIVLSLKKRKEVKENALVVVSTFSSLKRSELNLFQGVNSLSRIQWYWRRRIKSWWCFFVFLSLRQGRSQGVLRWLWPPHPFASLF